MTDLDPLVTTVDSADDPVPFLMGRFSLFETPGGGMHLTWRPDGEEEDQHIDVPGWILKVARQQKEGSGSFMGMLRSMTGNGE